MIGVVGGERFRGGDCAGQVMCAADGGVEERGSERMWHGAHRFPQ